MDTNEHDALPWELHLVKLVLSGTVCSKSASTHKSMILYMNKQSQNLWVFGFQHTKNVDMLIKM